MTKATIILIDSKFLGEFYFSQDPAALARKMLSEGYYDEAGTFESFEQGDAAAEDMFDMTNNPYRQDERLIKYGRRRSVSVGDMVKVDGEYFLCRPNNWIKVEMPAAPANWMEV